MLSTVQRILEDGIARSEHLGAQVYVSVNGKSIAELTIGESRIGVPMSSDTLNLWMSAVKPVAAVALAQLVEQKRIAFDDRVAMHLPEFGVNGKEPITIAHLLTHTGGFRLLPDAWLSLPYEQIIANICAMKLEPRWVPGEKAGYHPRSSWFILGEIIRRLDGRTYDRYVRDMIFKPLGMSDSWIGLPRDRYDDYGLRIGAMFDTAKGAPRRNDPSFGVPSADECANVFPGSNGRGPIRELGRFYEMLMSGGELDGARIFPSESVTTITSPQRVGMLDHTFRQVVDWGYGFLLNHSRATNDAIAPYGYGDAASPETFGHSGAQSSCAFCDPQRKLVVAWVCNGMPGDAVHQQRQQAINNAIYADLFY